MSLSVSLFWIKVESPRNREIQLLIYHHLYNICKKKYPCLISKHVSTCLRVTEQTQVCNCCYTPMSVVFMYACCCWIPATFLFVILIKIIIVEVCPLFKTLRQKMLCLIYGDTISVIRWLVYLTEIFNIIIQTRFYTNCIFAVRHYYGYNILELHGPIYNADQLHTSCSV